MDAMKRTVYGPVRGRQHNSQELDLFFLHMLLGASLVQQKGRLQEKNSTYENRRAACIVLSSDILTLLLRVGSPYWYTVYTHIQYKT